MAELASSENIWVERNLYDDLEIAYQTHLQKLRHGDQSDFKPFEVQVNEAQCAPENLQETQGGLKTSIADEIAKARKHIRHTLDDLETCKSTGSKAVGANCLESVMKKLSLIEENILALTKRVEAVEAFVSKGSKPSVQEAEEKPTPVVEQKEEGEKKEDEDDFELFGSDDEEDEEAERVKQERLKAYEEKKSKKPQLVAKSNIILDVKPWDDETDMVELEKCVRSIEMDGLLWGASKLIPLAYGIKKLQISCVVEDDKVSTEDLEEKIVAFEDYIQSMDIAAFNKV